MKKILIANRGEIAVRICRAATDAGLATVALYSTDDVDGLHVRLADEVISLQAAGPRAYLDIDTVIAAAQTTKADAIHPGYGFLSENADFAAAVEAAGITFVGPKSETLRVFGDKLQARDVATECGIPVLAGSSPNTTLGQATDFLQSVAGTGGMLIKAVAGGGGRGMRHVTTPEELEQAWPIASAEATAAFGNGQLYVEEYLPSARHIEVQILGDGTGDVIHAGERECTLQRQYQKLVEIAPSPGLSPAMRDSLTTAAVTLGRKVNYRGLGTVEFLVSNVAERFVFIEVNPRLQVEHTVTEEVHGVDLVDLQLQIAAGRSLLDLDVTSAAADSVHGFAIQVRLNTETMNEHGQAKPASGTLRTFEPPSGPGIRTDTHGYVGYTTAPAFDSLLAKLVVRSSSR